MTLGILVSYADVVDKSREDDPRFRQIDEVADEGHPLVWDSGAFSVFTGNAAITPERHGEWVLAEPKSASRRFVGLDVIGDAEATLTNYRVQREMGAPVEPTVHYGDPITQVDRLLEVADTEWLNVGGLVPYLRGSRNLRNVAAFIAAVRRRAPHVKIHALGCTTPSVLRSVHVDAVDSSSWLTAARYRKVFLFDDRRVRWRLYLVKSNTAALRDETWKAAYRDAQWLRSQYGVAPSELIERANDLHFLLSLTIAGVAKFADYVARLHGRPITMYLAGSDPSETARCDAVRNQDRATPTTTPEVPA